MGDEKYFTFANNNLDENDHFYTDAMSKTPENVKFAVKEKFKPKVLNWKILLKPTVQKIDTHFGRNWQAAITQRRRPIECFWALLTLLVYDGGCEAKTERQLIGRIRRKLKEVAFRSSKGPSHDKDHPGNSPKN